MASNGPFYAPARLSRGVVFVRQGRVLPVVAVVVTLAFALLHSSIPHWVLGACQPRRTSDLRPIWHSAPLTDGHNDLAIWLRAFYGNRINHLNASSTLTGQVDLPRLRAGRLRAQFWSGYVPCPADESADFPESQYYETIHDTLQQIDLIHRLHRAFPEHLQLARSSSDMWRIFQASDHLIAGLIGLEGLHQIGNSASVMRIYHQLGVRYITLTHDCHNRYADAALAATPRHGGLSRAGEELIHEMNRLGMMVDLSHVSDETMRDALRVSRAPVMFSHSNPSALCPHPRNVPDDVLRMVADNGGVVMVSFYPAYLACDDAARATLQDVANHIMYIGDLVGYDHVGIGSDFDGMARGVTGLEDVSKYPDLLEELTRRGVRARDLANLVGKNVLRVLRETEQVSEAMSGMAPLEDTVRPFFGNASASSP